MRDLQKILLLDWYQQENIALSFNKEPINEKKQNKIIPDSQEIEDLTSLSNIIQYIDEKPLSGLKKYSNHSWILEGNSNPDFLVINDFTNSVEQNSKKNILYSDERELLEKMLSAIDINLNENSIINIFFWRTPGDRNPTKDEIEDCMPAVKKLIKILAPKYIITLGDLALMSIMERNCNLMDSRGKKLNCKYSSIPIFALFHPRLLIKQPSLKRLAWEDLKFIKENINTNKNGTNS
ncbi:MAG: uracil-DNA glycosylase [Hyphomicrobiales bacterium]